MIRRIDRFAILAAVLAGCATLPADDGLSFPERRDRLSGIEHWEMRGRIAIDTGQDAYQGRFNWWQEANNLSLLIRGPFGAGSVEISGDAAALTVRSRGDQYQLTDPEIELSELLGWWVPVTSLKSWLLGMPDQAYESRPAYSGDKVLERLEQRAWLLEYTDYQVADGLLVPRRIELRHDTLRLIVTIDTWSAADWQQARLN